MASSTQQDKPNNVGIKDVAAKLGTEPRELRRFVRRMELGVGRGTRYAWPSMSDPAVREITAAWRAAHAD